MASICEGDGEVIAVKNHVKSSWIGRFREIAYIGGAAYVQYHI